MQISMYDSERRVWSSKNPSDAAMARSIVARLSSFLVADLGNMDTQHTSTVVVPTSRCHLKHRLLTSFNRTYAVGRGGGVRYVTPNLNYERDGAEEVG